VKSLVYFILSLLVVTTIINPTYVSGNGLPKAHGIGLSKIIDPDLAVEQSKINANQTSPMISNSSLYSNPRFVLFDNKSGMVGSGLRSFWNDTDKSCNTNFKCTANFSTGWKDKSSFQISTTNNTNNTWSWIYGQPIDVKPKEKYQLVTHMKLNQLSMQSHIPLEGFNETSNKWDQISECPSGISGPLEWQEFSCVIEIPENTTKIRPVLNAGWSSQLGKEAITWLDSLYMVKLEGPVVFDVNLKAELVYQGLDSPTSMAFLGPNDILVLEDKLEDKAGTVQRIVNGVKLGKPLLDLDVPFPEGLLGIAVEKNVNMNLIGTDKELTYVFIYVAGTKKVSDDPIKGNVPVGNRLYRYQFVNNTLVNPKLLLDLPAGKQANGGPILIGPDKHLYLAVGELYNESTLSMEKNRALNHEGKDADDPDGRGGILRIDQNGQPIGTHGILGDEEPLNKYYAYGIRNSFGIDFDPITGKLWDTENGPQWGDEINLVEPGFNSGWRKVQGIWNVDGGEHGEEKKGNLASEKPDSLVDFGGKGRYSPPEFTWNKTIGPTAIKFISTDKLGKEYENDILVADTNGPRIYHFELDQNRTALHLQGPLIDKVAESDDELANIIFAEDFGGRITDLKIGPDGYVYVVLFDVGKIYRIVPNHLNKDIILYLDEVSRDKLVTG
jgi:aldose sugar dehydrogenase